MDTSWPPLTAIVSVHAAEKKVKVLILVRLILIALLVIPSLKNNAYRCPRLVIGLKKRNMNLKSTDNTPQKDSDSSSLIHLSSVTVVGAVDGQEMVQSPGSSSGTKKKKSNPSDKSKVPSTKHSKEKPVKSPTSNPHRSSADARIEELDQKWLDRFNRLEALLLAKTLDKPEPTFGMVKVTPTTSPPVGITRSTKPFIRPAEDLQTTDLVGTDHSQQRQATDKSLSSTSTKQLSSDLHGSCQTVVKPQSTGKSLKDSPSTDHTSDLAGTDSPTVHQVPSRSSSAPTGRQSPVSMDSDSDFSDQPPVDIFVEEGELSDKDPDATATDPDQTLSEEQNYRETMRGIRSFMGWTHIPDMDSAAATSDDNPFAGPKAQLMGKVSVKMPTDEWLCRKMGKLNITLVEGYPSRSSEAGGLLKDQFVRPARSQSKWYGSVPDQQKSDTGTGKTVSSWSTDASKVNSTYSHIARAAGIASTPPASHQISQDNLRRWKKSAREASTICNQAAGFNRCLYKVQENMQSQLKLIRSDLSKGKLSSRVSGAADELQFLMNFNSSITQAMAKTLEHLSDFVFVTVANTTLARRDSYLSHLKTGIKPDTLAALRTALLYITTLFPDEALRQAEQDIANFESKGQLHAGKKGRFHHYERPDKRADNKKPDRPAWKNIGNRGHSKKARGKASYYSSRPAKGQQSYK